MARLCGRADANFHASGKAAVALTCALARVSSRRCPYETCGRDRPLAGAEGATAPEPLRQKDRRLMALWKAAGAVAGSPKG